MAGPETIEVVLRFTPAATPHVRERRWHPSQSLTPTPEGGCILRVTVSEPLEMQPWIRSWGAQVQVVAPEWLTARIAAELRQAAAQYADEMTSAHAGDVPNPAPAGQSREIG